MRWLDTETCGLVGPGLTIQWADDDGPVSIHEVWYESCRSTLKLITETCRHDVGFWNGTFDWFHLQKLHNILSLLPASQRPTIAGWKAVEREAVFGHCIKPRSACDVMLWARKGPAQSLMARDDIRVKKVPARIAPMLAEELQSRVAIPDIYFAKSERGYEWQVVENEDRPDFPDVVLRFRAAGGLKPVARHLLGVETHDYPVPDQFMPKNEHEYDPHSGDWEDVLAYHIAFWHANPEARKYAADDVDLTRRVWAKLGAPPPGDDDSELACCVGSSRWRGFKLDLKGIEERRIVAAAVQESAPRAPKTVMHNLQEMAGPEAGLAIEDTTDATLKAIAEDPAWKGTKAAKFAANVREARHAQKERELCEKLLEVRRFHPDAVVVGTLSNRMAGRGGLNAHAIPSPMKGSTIRDTFVLRGDGLPTMDGGDFWAFEVVLMAAVYRDPGLIAALKSGSKMHALFGSSMYGMKYEDIYDNETGEEVDPEIYGASKKALFAKAYGAQDKKLAAVLGLSEEQVKAGSRRFETDFPGVGAARKRNEARFCSMRQVGEIGSRIEWHEPADFCESFLGFRRYFSLENRICKALYELAQTPPKEMRSAYKVHRTVGREQTAGGAAQTALYACAFGIQASSMRQAGNHEIQSPGATITKRLQRRIWDQQPAGIGPWVVQPLQVHDSVDVPRTRDVDLRPVVGATIESFRAEVPLLRMDWKRGKKTWGDKKGK